MTFNIKPVLHAERKNVWCGPTVVSSITGLDTGRAAAAIRYVSGKRSVKGTSSPALQGTLRLLGYSTKVRYLAARPKDAPTLAAWLRETYKSRGADVFLLVAGNHWCLVQGRRYVCGLTKAIVTTGKAPRRRARVTEVYLVRKTADVSFGHVLPDYGRLSSNALVSARARMQARKYGIDVEHCCGSEIWVYGPDWISEEVQEANDPFIGERYCGDSWIEAEDKIREYVSLITENPDWFIRKAT